MAEETLLDFLTRHEGKRNRVYDDATGQTLKPGMVLIGHPTIGVGINLEEPISEDTIQQMLREKTNEAENECIHSFPWYAELTEPRRWAMLSLRFNLGLPRLLGFKKFLKHMSLGEYESAEKELLDSDAARKQPNRYKELGSMIRGSEKV